MWSTGIEITSCSRQRAIETRRTKTLVNTILTTKASSGRTPLRPTVVNTAAQYRFTFRQADDVTEVPLATPKNGGFLRISKNGGVDGNAMELQMLYCIAVMLRGCVSSRSHSVIDAANILGPGYERKKTPPHQCVDVE